MIGEHANTDHITHGLSGSIHDRRDQETELNLCVERRRHDTVKKNGEEAKLVEIPKEQSHATF